MLHQSLEPWARIEGLNSSPSIVTFPSTTLCLLGFTWELQGGREHDDDRGESSEPLPVNLVYTRRRHARRRWMLRLMKGQRTGAVCHWQVE